MVGNGDRMFFRSQTSQCGRSLPETTLSPTEHAEVTVLPREGTGSEPSSASPRPHCTADTNPATPGPVGRAERRGCGHRGGSTPPRVLLPPLPAHRGRTDLSKAASLTSRQWSKERAPRQDGPNSQDPPKSLEQTLKHSSQLRLSDNSIRALEKIHSNNNKNI